MILIIQCRKVTKMINVDNGNKMVIHTQGYYAYAFSPYAKGMTDEA